MRFYLPLFQRFNPNLQAQLLRRLRLSAALETAQLVLLYLLIFIHTQFLLD
jgi:hypothetical protein